MEEIVLICEENTGERLDKYISMHTEFTRSHAVKLIESGLVLDKEGKFLDKKTKVKYGDITIIQVPEPKAANIIPEDIPLDIIYEDEDVLVVNKPKGMVVHPAPGNDTGTLVNAVMYHCGDSLSGINGSLRPGIVHRIDKDTSGLLMIAKNDRTHEFLSEQLKERKALRKYWALVNGNIKEEEGTINKPIARHPLDRKKMAVVNGGREAVTHFKVLERFGDYTLVECILETGRTHQIRVHMASVGHSIVGDKAYGLKKEKFALSGQLLHAKTIGFVHPKTGELMTFSCGLPEDFEKVLAILRSKM